MTVFGTRLSHFCAPTQYQFSPPRMGPMCEEMACTNDLTKKYDDEPTSVVSPPWRPSSAVGTLFLFVITVPFVRTVVVSRFGARRAPSVPLSRRHIDFGVPPEGLHQRHRHGDGRLAPRAHRSNRQQRCLLCTPLWWIDSAPVAHRSCRYLDAVSTFPALLFGAATSFIAAATATPTAAAAAAAMPTAAAAAAATAAATAAAVRLQRGNKCVPGRH